MLVPKKLGSFALALALLLPMVALVAPAAAAAEESPVTWLILDTVKPNKAQQWAGLVTENYGPVLDAMQAEGHVLSWGLIARASGPGGQATHAGWVTYPNLAAMDTVDAAFKAHFAEATPEDMAAIGEGFAEAGEPHGDFIRHLRAVAIEGAEGGAAPKYMMTADWNSRPGKTERVKELYEGVRTVFDSLLADGTITAYGLGESMMHDGGPEFVSWYGLPNLAAMGAVHDALDAWQEEQGEAGMQAMTEAFDLSSHSDTLWEVMHLGGGGGEAEDGEGGE